MILHKPPKKFRKTKTLFFLGGSINKGKTENWQTEIENLLERYDVEVANPRRVEWNDEWDEDPSRGTQFEIQVEWEISAQDETDIFLYVFKDGGLSPISLFELGVYGTKNKNNTLVYIAEEYPRSGNLIIYCRRFGMRFTRDWGEFKRLVMGMVGNRKI